MGKRLGLVPVFVYHKRRTTLLLQKAEAAYASRTGLLVPQSDPWRTVNAGLLAGPLGPGLGAIPRLSYPLLLYGGQQTASDLYQGKYEQGAVNGLATLLGGYGSRRQIGGDLRGLNGLLQRPSSTSTLPLKPNVETAALGAAPGQKSSVETAAPEARPLLKLSNEEVAALGVRVELPPELEAQLTPKVVVRRFTSAEEFNNAANAAQPNTRYEFGNYSWTTDAQGNISVAQGRVTLGNSGRNKALQSQIGNEGASTDIGFHIIADSFNGPTNRLNVVPGNGVRLSPTEPNLNQGAWKRFENKIRSLVDTGNMTGDTVDIKVELIRNPGNTSSRPDLFRASYRVNNGDWITQEFENKK